MREVAAALPSSLRLFQQPPPKTKTAGSCIGQISLFLSLGSPRRTMRMLPLTSHTGTSARLHSAPADGSGAAAGVGTDLSTSSARGPTRAPSAPAAPPRGAPGPAAPSGKTGRDAETRRCGGAHFLPAAPARRSLAIPRTASFCRAAPGHGAGGPFFYSGRKRLPPPAPPPPPRPPSLPLPVLHLLLPLPAPAPHAMAAARSRSARRPHGSPRPRCRSRTEAARPPLVAGCACWSAGRKTRKCAPGPNPECRNCGFCTALHGVWR